MVVKRSSDSLTDVLNLPHIGVDEAGRGCLAGPVVASAVIFAHDADIENHLAGMTDSKQLSEKERDRLAPLIIQHCLFYGIGLAWPLEIDHCNIVSANYRAMTRAVFHLAKKSHLAGYPFLSSLPLLLIDGNLPIHESQWRSREKVSDFYPQGLPGATTKKPNILTLEQQKGTTAKPSSFNGANWGKDTLAELDLCTHSFYASSPQQIAIVKGDQRVPAIAAASILAKTKRDFIMKRLDALYPEYGLSRHKGYGTKAHYDALSIHSPCPIHRKTFLKKLSNKQEQLSLF